MDNGNLKSYLTGFVFLLLHSPLWAAPCQNAVSSRSFASALQHTAIIVGA